MKKIIQTPREYRQAIRSGVVKEVSPDLLGTLTRSSFGTLTRTDRKYAWVSSSSNLYQFLVLNQRYSVGHIDPRSGDLTVVSEEAIDGLSRIVGIPNPPFNNLFEDGGIGKQTSTNQLLVFKDPKYKTVQQPMIPTFDYFIDIVNSYRGKNNPRLPSIIAEKLNKKYRSSIGDPLRAYSKITGFPNGREHKRRIYEEVKSIFSSTRSPVIPDDWPANPTNPQGPPFGYGTRQLTRAFFTKFANKYINNISKSNLKRLVIGFRVLLDEVYSASPLFTGFGIGYRLGANPLIGKSNARLNRIERLTGQEYQVLNTYWWSRFQQDRIVNDGFPDNGRIRNKLRDKHGNAMLEFFESQARDSTNYRDNYFQQANDGFFQLNPSARYNTNNSIVRIKNNANNGSFKEQVEIRSSGIIYTSKNNSLSSDTITAKWIDTSRHLISRNDLEKQGVKLRTTNSNLWKSLKNREFVFYCNTGGGIDNVRGSRFNDVIVSSQWQADHGMSTISAGAGDDLISPGRGANLVLTGSGSDRILLDQNELFGDMTLMDFKKNEDKLILSNSIKYTGLGTNVLIVGDFTNSLKYKRLLLTGHSKEIWHQDDIEFL